LGDIKKREVLLSSADFQSPEKKTELCLLSVRSQLNSKYHSNHHNVPFPAQCAPLLSNSASIAHEYKGKGKPKG
jgi:hypothetical protein